MNMNRALEITELERKIGIACAVLRQTNGISIDRFALRCGFPMPKVVGSLAKGNCSTGYQGLLQTLTELGLAVIQQDYPYQTGHPLKVYRPGTEPPISLMGQKERKRDQRTLERQQKSLKARAKRLRREEVRLQRQLFQLVEDQPIAAIELEGQLLREFCTDASYGKICKALNNLEATGLLHSQANGRRLMFAHVPLEARQFEVGGWCVAFFGQKSERYGQVKEVKSTAHPGVVALLVTWADGTQSIVGSDLAHPLSQENADRLQTELKNLGG